MENLNKRLVEVEYILKKLEDQYIKKIPQEFWTFIEENKDKNYVFNYDENKNLIDQNLSIDTISILTYINMEYLLDAEQKKEMEDLLKKDEIYAEQEKSKRYSSKVLFNTQRETKITKQIDLIEIKKEKWYEKIFSFIKNMFNK